MLTPENHVPEESEATLDSSSTSSVATQASDLALMKIGDGYALLFADHTPQDMGLLGFKALGREAGQRLSDKISAVVGAGNLVALGGPSALPDVQGIVRLAPESMQLLSQTGNTLMQSSGQSLGAIVNANGTIVGQARLLPLAEGAGSALGPLLGPSMILLALQMQLASISRRVDENIGLTRDVLRTIHEDQWTTLLGLHETSLHALNEAEAAGTVNDHIFAPLATRQADLRKYRNLFVNFVKAHITALNGDPKNSRSYIQKQFDQIIADTHGMLMAEFAWYRAQVLRGILISHDAKNLDANDRLLAHLVEETKREHDDAMLEITSLLTEVERQVRLLSVLPVARSLPFTSKRRNIDDAVKMTDALSTSVAALRNQIHVPRELVAPKLSIFKAELPDKVREIFTWALPEDSQILVLADANQEKLLSNNVYLGIAKECFIVADQGEFNKEGSIESITPLADIRYVRYLERSKKGPSLEIITKDENLSFTFDSWAAEGEALAATHRLANVLSSVMNLPEEEKREDSLLELTHSPSTLLKEVFA